MLTNVKEITYENRLFKIKKLDAMQSSYYAHKLQEAGAAAIAGDSVSEYPTIEDYKTAVKTFLRVVYESLPIGDVAVIDDRGYFAVNNLEYNGPLLQLLFIESKAWSMGSFFVESHLKACETAYRNMYPANLPTSQDGSN